MKSIAIIPARGGSKRFPRKNILDFYNHPIISYTINAAIKSRCFSKVVVSTEDDEIKDISKKYGAFVHNRPQKLSGDNAKVADVLLNCIEHFENSGSFFDVVCCLFPTSPLRDFLDVRSIMDLMKNNKLDYCMAITKMPYPAWQALKENRNNIFTPFWPKIINKSSHEIGELYVDNGSTYAIRINALKKKRSLNGDRIKGYKMEFYKSIDIDYKEDFELAKFFYEKLKK